MSKLWVFGDSFSAEFKLNTDWCREYVGWKKYIPKVYSSVISEKLNIPYTNKAVGGKDNYTIFEQIWDNANDIGEDDIIIIGWSMVTRFRLANPAILNWETFIPGYKYNGLEQCQISKNTFNEILINRTQMNYEVELTKIANFINFAFKTQKIIHWRWDDMGRLKQYSTINQETSNNVFDLHYSETGHLELADDIIKCIQNENRINNLCWFAETLYYNKNKSLI